MQNADLTARVPFSVLAGGSQTGHEDCGEFLALLPNWSAIDSVFSQLGHEVEPYSRLAYLLETELHLVNEVAT